MDIIDVVLGTGNLRPKWSDIKEAIIPFPYISAQEEHNLRDCLVNSAVFPEFEQPIEEISMFLAQCSITEIPQQEEDFQEDFEVPVNKSSDEYLEWLETTGFSIVLETMNERSLGNAGNLIQASIILLKLADDLDYLRPHNDSHLGHHLVNMSFWRIYWHALIAEMKTVKERCSPEIRNSGVYVLTTGPFKEFLRLLAGQLLAKALSVMYENEN